MYQIPEEEFEEVIMKYLSIDRTELREKTVYHPRTSSYEYRPRGFDETEYPEYPYSEVLGFTENGDGTITMDAQVVFPYACDSKVYAHKVTVRPGKDGTVQYVSNQVMPAEDNGEAVCAYAKIGWRIHQIGERAEYYKKENSETLIDYFRSIINCK